MCKRAGQADLCVVLFSWLRLRRLLINEPPGATPTRSWQTRAHDLQFKRSSWALAEYLYFYSRHALVLVYARRGVGTSNVSASLQARDERRPRARAWLAIITSSATRPARAPHSTGDSFNKPQTEPDYKKSIFEPVRVQSERAPVWLRVACWPGEKKGEKKH